MNDANHVKISIGLHVRIVLKKDQRTGKLTKGVVKDILTKSQRSANSHNVVKATMDALQRLNDPIDVANKRGMTLEQLFHA